MIGGEEVLLDVNLDFVRPRKLYLVDMNKDRGRDKTVKEYTPYEEDDYIYVGAYEPNMEGPSKKKTVVSYSFGKPQNVLSELNPDLAELLRPSELIIEDPAPPKKKVKGNVRFMEGKPRFEEKVDPERDYYPPTSEMKIDQATAIEGVKPNKKSGFISKGNLKDPKSRIEEIKKQKEEQKEFQTQLKAEIE
jgi:hypothetical protein